jgi:superfamily II DNA helicase RecQ
MVEARSILGEISGLEPSAMATAPAPIRVFGFPGFRGVQADVVARVLAGQRTLAVMPTGAGKSLCYQLPSVMNAGTTIVISPLIALMHDQIRSATSAGIRAAALTSVDENRAETLERFRSGSSTCYMSRQNARTAMSSGGCCAKRTSRCSLSMRRIACPNGGMISGPITGCCAAVDG